MWSKLGIESTARETSLRQSTSGLSGAMAFTYASWLITHHPYHLLDQWEIIPTCVVNKVRQLAYKFICVAKIPFPSAKWSFQRPKGGWGKRISHMRRDHKIWTKDEWIYSSWMTDRYVKGEGLQNIMLSPNRDSVAWKSIRNGDDMLPNTYYVLLWRLHSDMAWSWKRP